MDKLENAITDVEDMIDVAETAGSAVIYRHNGGVNILKNILKCLKENNLETCNSENLQRCKIGSYKCYINVPDIDALCDKCLATEIRLLNSFGVKTIGCCCGHGEKVGYIQVSQDSIKKIEKLGYTKRAIDEDGGGEWCFLPKSVLLNMECVISG